MKGSKNISKSWETVTSPLAPSSPTTSTNRLTTNEETNNLNQINQDKPKEVKFMFGGDDDSDSCRSYAVSMLTPPIPKLDRPTSSRSITSTGNKDDRADGLESPSSPMRKLTSTSASPSIQRQAKTVECLPGPSSSRSSHQTLLQPVEVQTHIFAGAKPIASQNLALNNININREPTAHINTSASTANNSNAGQPISRTQQKLELQRQFGLVPDLNSLHHPQNQKQLSLRLDRSNRAFGWLRHHHNPIRDSLFRVLDSEN